MRYIFRGEVYQDNELVSRLETLEYTLSVDIDRRINIEMALKAISSLGDELTKPEVISMLGLIGIGKSKARAIVERIRMSLSYNALMTKHSRELPYPLFEWYDVEDGTKQAVYPIGVLGHIGAGNELALSVLSIIEGLLAGNINIVKLPDNDMGISIYVLEKLLEIEPNLKPYIYAFPVSSKEIKIMQSTLRCCDAIAIWGSDTAVKGVRDIAPPHAKLIEWGHRISFAYLCDNKDISKDILGLGKEICETNQLYCSSPQFIFYETGNLQNIEKIAMEILEAIEYHGETFSYPNLDIDTQSDITINRVQYNFEELLGDKKILTSDLNPNINVTIDYTPRVIGSLQYRNICLMPIRREELKALLFPYRGYLQTVGLSCKETDREEIGSLLYNMGVNRVTRPSSMSMTYVGEPHDGQLTLSCYTRIVSSRE